jgi:hypothetical protein
VFRVNNKDTFLRKIIKLTLGPLSLGGLGAMQGNTKITTTVFAAIISV